MREKIVYIVTILITLFVGITGTIVVLEYIPEGEAISKTVKEVSITETNTIKSAVEKIYDAVVYIESYQNGKSIGSGTGFVYKKDDKNGYIITNYHVIDGASGVKITNNANQTVDAKVLGGDEYADIAVLSIDVSAVLEVAKMGDSTALELGDTLFTVGSPEGSDYAGTVTKGILSAKDRLVAVSLENTQTSDYYMQVLQTDAAINPGNSGGPICNINGEVIGITNMKLVDDTVEGMGFAIPIEEALKVVEILEKDGKITRPKLGISVSTLNNRFELYYQSGILVPNDIESGLVVVSIEKNTSAESAGLKKGDIITKLAGKKINDLADFRYELYKHNPGDEIEITYLRDDTEKTVKIKINK